jgi:hypothetical protein
MKQLVMLIGAGLVALVLSGCGEDKSKQPEMNTEMTTTTTEPQKAEESKPMETTTTTTTGQGQE